MFQEALFLRLPPAGTRATSLQGRIYGVSQKQSLLKYDATHRCNLAAINIVNRIFNRVCAQNTLRHPATYRQALLAYL
jgi:hypothetical protein